MNIIEKYEIFMKAMNKKLKNIERKEKLFIKFHLYCGYTITFYYFDYLNENIRNSNEFFEYINKQMLPFQMKIKYFDYLNE